MKRSMSLLSSAPVGAVCRHQWLASTELTSNPDIHLSPFTPERLQIVDARHLVRSIVRPLEPDLAKIAANEICQVGGSFMKGFLHRFRNAGIKEKQIDFFIVLVPFPDANDATVEDDRRQRIIDQLSFPTGERLVGMFGGNESINNFALSFEVRIAVGDETDGSLRQFESHKIVEVRLADQELIFSAFYTDRRQLGFDFSGATHGIGNVDTCPPGEVFHSRRSLCPEVLCGKLRARLFQS